MIANSIDYIGVNENLPTNIKYFKEELFYTSLNKKKESQNIHKIISVASEVKVNSLKLINTQTRVSNEGQKLSGKKLLVELNIFYRIKYITNSKEKYLYVLKSNSTKVMYIAVPKEINNCKIEELLRKRKLTVEPYIEDLYANVRSFEEVYIRSLLLLNININK